MTREFRANLLFLVGLIILITPGFIILMNKKLSAMPGKSNALPDPVPYQIAYMQPLPAPPVPRREPKAVRTWVRGLIAERLGEPAALAFDQSAATGPVISDQFVTQFLYLSPSTVSQPATITLLRWDDRVDLSAKSPGLQAEFAGGEAAFTQPTAQAIDMPKDIRHNLQNTGYIDPPGKIWWVSFTGTVPENAGELKKLRLTVPGVKPSEMELIDFAATRANPIAAAVGPTSEAHH